MKHKILFGGIIVLVGLASFVAGALATLHVVATASQRRVEETRREWEQTVSREIAIGEKKSDVDAWFDLRVPRTKAPLGIGLKNSALLPTGPYDPENKRYSTIVARIDTPASIVCADELVWVQIGIGTDDRVSYRKVFTSPGSCL